MSPDMKHYKYRAPLPDRLAERSGYLIALLVGATLSIVVTALVMRWFA